LTETPTSISERAVSSDAPAYRVLARKYRPQTFADLLGQDAMVRTLANAFATGRIAQAFMLTGVRGVGKTTTARLIARALNYTGPGSENGPTIHMTEMGEHCAAILESRHIDVIELDAASHTGVDNVREIIEAVRYKPISSRYKLYIIDEVHMLSKPAFNALLKTLEEPPPHVKFVFATTEIGKIPITILSRCQRFDLRRLDVEVLMQHFAKVARAENVEIDEEAVRMIARAAEGSARDGLSLLDQAIAHCGAKIGAECVASMLGLVDRTRIIDLFERLIEGDAGGALLAFEKQYEYGADPSAVLAGLADFVHWVSRLKILPGAADKSRTETEVERGRAFAQSVPLAALTRAWQLLLKGMTEVRDAADARVAAEMLLIRLAYGLSLPASDELAKLAGEQPTASPSADRRVASRVAPDEGPPLPPPGSSESTARASPDLDGQLALDVAPSDPQLLQRSPGEVFQHFRDVVRLVGDRRDVKLKSELERHVRPVRVAPGRIEISLLPGAPPGLPGELARKLEVWTGERFLILISKETGEPPLREQALTAQDAALREAYAHPAVRAVLDRFPGAEITAVRDVAPPADPEAMLVDPEQD
jgi:DNA polymerase-3 subunit gamma/tau